MTNPTPRPALRKAEDATVHPAAPRPARSPRPAATRTPTPVAVEPAAPAPSAEPVAVPAKPAKASAGPVPAKAASSHDAKPSKDGKDAKHGKSKSGKGKRKFGGATSDHLRVEAEPVPEGVASGTDATRSGKSAKRAAAGLAPVPAAPAPSTPATSSAPVKPSKVKAAASTRHDLMQGKPVELDVVVPKQLRKAAAKRAKSEGLDLQTVVIDALHAYVTAPPR